MRSPPAQGPASQLLSFPLCVCLHWCLLILELSGRQFAICKRHVLAAMYTPPPFRDSLLGGNADVVCCCCCCCCCYPHRTSNSQSLHARFSASRQDRSCWEAISKVPLLQPSAQTLCHSFTSRGWHRSLVTARHINVASQQPWDLSETAISLEKISREILEITMECSWKVHRCKVRIPTQIAIASKCNANAAARCAVACFID